MIEIELQLSHGGQLFFLHRLSAASPIIDNMMIDLEEEVDTFIGGNQVEAFKDVVQAKTGTSNNMVQWWIIGAIACRKIGELQLNKTKR